MLRITVLLALQCSVLAGVDGIPSATMALLVCEFPNGFDWERKLTLTQEMWAANMETISARFSRRHDRLLVSDSLLKAGTI